MDSALWRPELPPWEVVFRAAFVYLFVQLLFLQRDVMRATRVSEDELLAHVRRLGKESLRDVKDAFLERSGSITIVLRGGAGR